MPTDRETSPKSRRLALALAVACTTAALGSQAIAQVVVIQSSAPGVTRGSTLANSARLSIPSGKSAVLMLPSGATRTVSGPFDGPVSTLTQGVPADQTVIDAVTKIVTTGGASSKTVGAVRAGGDVAPAAVGPFSWTDVPITVRGGNMCAPQGKALRLARVTVKEPLTVTLVDIASQKRADVAFAAGAATAGWPAALPNKAGSYALIVPGADMAQFRLRLLAAEPAGDETLRVLHKEGCKAQFEAYARKLMQ